jgi:predicted nucleic acid-binding protein
MIVVDTSLIAYFFIAGERSEQVERAFRRDHEWAAPLLWRSEFRNVLSLCLREGGLSLEDALSVMDAALELMAGREYEVNSSEVLRLAEESGCPARACEFVSLARDLGTKLVTIERQTLKKFPDVAISLDEFAG